MILKPGVAGVGLVSLWMMQLKSYALVARRSLTVR